MHIRPAIRPRRAQNSLPFQPLPTEGDGILAMVQRKMNEKIPPYVKKPTSPVYTPSQEQHSSYKKNTMQPIIYPVRLVLSVTETGVKVKLDVHSYELYKNYFAKAIKPPMIIYINALMKAGYTDDQLDKVVSSYQKWNDPVYLDSIQRDIDRIWPSSVKRNIRAAKALKAVKKI